MPAGLLILASTDLGNPQDIPLRSLEAIREADLLIFEEDRPARRILKTAGIHRDYLKLSEHREQETLQEAHKALKDNQTIVYSSDQGTPNLADPGQELLKIAYQCGSKIQIIPGPSSLTAALAACPFPHNSFEFLGFLPRDENNRLKTLKQYKSSQKPLVVMDTPYRLKALLESCSRTLGKNREALLALDISGPHEQYWFHSLAELTQKIKQVNEKLNFVLVIDT